MPALLRAAFALAALVPAFPAAAADRVDLGDGVAMARLVADGYTLDLRMETVTGDGYAAPTPVLRVLEGDEAMLRVEGASSGWETPQGAVRLAELDRASPGREAVFTSFSGGAHCCTEVSVVRRGAAGYEVVEVGSFDGEGPLAEDVDGDGVMELTGPDNAFLYAFDCYACSLAPLAILSVEGGTVRDVSAEPRFLAAHRAFLAKTEAGIARDVGAWTPGTWGGWIAAKARVGEVDDAWARFLAAYDPARDEGAMACEVAADPCPDGRFVTVPLPRAIRDHLARHGYPVPTGG